MNKTEVINQLKKLTWETEIAEVICDIKPIYDKEQTFDYGWADFDQVARILDVINNRLEEIKNNN